MDDLALSLARTARSLGLSARHAHEADPAQLEAFALAVLEELAARGLLEGDEQLDCWATPRSASN